MSSLHLMVSTHRLLRGIIKVKSSEKLRITVRREQLWNWKIGILIVYAWMVVLRPTCMAIIGFPDFYRWSKEDKGKGYIPQLTPQHSPWPSVEKAVSPHCDHHKKRGYMGELKGGLVETKKSLGGNRRERVWNMNSKSTPRPATLPQYISSPYSYKRTKLVKSLNSAIHTNIRQKKRILQS